MPDGNESTLLWPNTLQSLYIIKLCLEYHNMLIFNIMGNISTTLTHNDYSLPRIGKQAYLNINMKYNLINVNIKNSAKIYIFEIVLQVSSSYTKDITSVYTGKNCEKVSPILRKKWENSEKKTNFPKIFP